MSHLDRDAAAVLGGVIGLLALATLLARALRRGPVAEAHRDTVDNLEARVRTWWIITAAYGVAAVSGPSVVVGLFAAVSFLAFREFATLLPTRPADHRALTLAVFLGIPLQYTAVARHWSGAFALLLPLGGFLVLSTGLALGGDTTGFLQRAAGIQWGLVACVYGPSYAPGLLMLDIPGYRDGGATLLLYLLVVVELSDVLQYVCGTLAGRHAIAPGVSPRKTVEGFVGGVVGASAVGAALWRLTPFRPGQAAVVALLATLAGFAGGLTMSAIKRDRGVKDFGAILAGHGGVLDRLDSLCFAAPVFFHLTRYLVAS